MLTIFSLVFLLCASARCDDVPTDEEVELAFREVEKALNDRQDIKALLQDVKDSVATKPDYKKNALGMAKALSTAVPKLKSDNGYTVAEGALLLASGIAENVPGGMIIASIATFLASVIGIINTDKSDKIRDTMVKVLQEGRDDDLIEEIDGFKAKSTDLIAFMKAFTQKDITDNVLPFIAVKTEHASAVGVLPALKKRIHKHIKSKDPAEAKRAFDFSVMYAQLVTLQDLALTQVVFLLKKDNPQISMTYANTKNGIIERSRNALSFWNNPKPEHAGSLVHYYPLGSSESGSFLRAYLKRVKVAEPEVWNPASYLLISVKWPSYHLKYEVHSSGGVMSPQSTSYLSFSTSTATSYEKITFDKRPDGYFLLRSGSGRFTKYAFIEDTSSPDYIIKKKQYPGEDKSHHFNVISYPGTDIITISSRKWPHKFFGGEKNKYSVILQNGNIGKDIQFYTHTCLRQEPGHRTYNCPEYTIAEG